MGVSQSEEEDLSDSHWDDLAGSNSCCARHDRSSDTKGGITAGLDTNEEKGTEVNGSAANISKDDMEKVGLESRYQERQNVVS